MLIAHGIVTIIILGLIYSAFFEKIPGKHFEHSKQKERAPNGRDSNIKP